MVVYNHVSRDGYETVTNLKDVHFYISFLYYSFLRALIICLCACMYKYSHSLGSHEIYVLIKFILILIVSTPQFSRSG